MIGYYEKYEDFSQTTQEIISLKRPMIQLFKIQL